MRPAIALQPIASHGTWPVHAALKPLLPGGLPKGSVVTSAGSVSLLLALVGAASAEGAWCAIAGLPSVGAEAAAEFGIALERTPIVAAPPTSGRVSGRAWAGLIAALIDAVDIVAARPGAALAAADLSRLAARARTKDTTLLLHLDRTARQSDTGMRADVQLEVSDPQWVRADGPRGRLIARRVTVTASGRGRYARPSTLGLWLPAGVAGATDGGVTVAQPDEARLPRVLSSAG